VEKIHGHKVSRSKVLADMHRTKADNPVVVKASDLMLGVQFWITCIHAVHQVLTSWISYSRTSFLCSSTTF
jgi:hypothetical protein